MSKTLLPSAPTSDEKAMLQARVMELSHYVESTNGPWKQLFPNPNLATNKTICELKILENQQTKDMRVLIYEAERPGGASTISVLSNHLVHPETVMVASKEDKGTLSFWVQDWLGTDDKECRETCLRIKFQAGAGLDNAFVLTYKTCQRQMEKIHENTKTVWKRGELSVAAAAPALPPLKPQNLQATSMNSKYQESEEEEEEEYYDEEEEEEEDYDEDEDDEDEDDEEYYDEDEDEEEEDETPHTTPKKNPLPSDILSRLALQDANKWKCLDCSVKNKESDMFCASCEAPKPGTEVKPAITSTPFSFTTKPSAPAAATTFSFSNTKDSKPFSFGTTGGDSKPSFNFSAASTTAATDAPAKSPFVFASSTDSTAPKTSASPFVFSTSTNEKPSGTTPFTFPSTTTASTASPTVTVKTVPTSPTTIPLNKAPSSPVKLDFGDKTGAGAAPLSGPRFSLTPSTSEGGEKSETLFSFASPKLRPEPSPSAAAVPEKSDFELRVEKFYTQYNPSKISEVPKLVEKYQSNQDVLFQKLLLKYPNAVIPPSSSTAAATATTPTASAVPSTMSTPIAPASSPFAAAAVSSPFAAAAASSPFASSTPKFGQTSGMTGLQPQKSTSANTPSLKELLMSSSFGSASSTGKTAFGAISETKQ